LETSHGCCWRPPCVQSTAGGWADALHWTGSTDWAGRLEPTEGGPGISAAWWKDWQTAAPVCGRQVSTCGWGGGDSHPVYADKAAAGHHDMQIRMGIQQMEQVEVGGVGSTVMVVPAGSTTATMHTVKLQASWTNQQSSMQAIMQHANATAVLITINTANGAPSTLWQMV